MSALPSAECEAARRRVEVAEQRRNASRHQVQDAQLQLQASQRQLDEDEADLEASRTQLRVEESRVPENAGSGHGNNLPPPTATATTAPVGSLPGYGHSGSRFERDGKAPRSSSANNVGMSGRGSFGGVSKDNPNPKSQAARPAISQPWKHGYFWVPDRTPKQVVSETRLSGGRYQFKGSIGSDPARVSGFTDRWQDGNEILQRASQDLDQGSDLLAFEVKVKPFQGQLPFIKAKATATRVIKSTGRTEEKAPEIGMELFSIKPWSSCIECGDHHALKDCLFVPKGYVHGCTLCNTRDHAVDSCNQFQDMSLKEKAKLLVYERGSLPMLETSPDQPEWHWYLKEYLREAGQDADVPKAFPWTLEFAKKVRDRDNFDGIQLRWVIYKDVDALPKDPAHGSFDAVHQLYWSDRV
ncbi:hypothetical protein NW768_004823 [Fusarium equiseti]|uniref:Uncharacterized protein n=1 Tax=Fusarium equiseti TaxID=61235 RepID=A0ABQ8RH91_FUSEQ|nr:hypothetical protein NW768_004823 [Fusarium equiseti]